MTVPSNVSADSGNDIKRQGFLFTPEVTFARPSVDLADRFGRFNGIGLCVEYKFKSNLQFGFDYNWFFGDSVKEQDLFGGIMGPSGQIIDQNGNFSVLRTEMRGHIISGQLAYVIPFSAKHWNSGLYVSAGVGVLIHKINIQASQVTIPQINGEYRAGYDRLTSGLVLRQFIGYQYMSGNEYNLRVGIEFNQGLTQGRRTWNFNTNSSGTDSRRDDILAFKAGLIVPVFTKKAEDEEFFID